MTDNPFADVDYGAAPADKPQLDQPPSENPFAQIDYLKHADVSTLGAFGVGAAENVGPMAAGLAGAGYGAEAGAAIGGPVGAFVGGIGGGLLGAYVGGSAQDYAVKSLPHDWRDPIEETEQAAAEKHPYASFLGGLVPMAMTMSPRLAIPAVDLPANATGMQRLMANPYTARLFGGAVQGAMELGNEKAEGQDADWAKVALSTTFGLVFNKTNAVGARIEGAGASLARFGERTPAPRVGVPTPEEAPAPTINDAQDVKVAGPGITEEVHRGSQEQDETAAQVAQEAKRTEDLILNPEPPAPPDVSNIVARMEPELIQEHDALIAQRQSLADLVANEGPESPAAKHLEDVNAAIQETTPLVKAAYERAAEAVGAETIEPEKAQKVGEAASAGANPPEAATPPAAIPGKPAADTGRAPDRTDEDRRQWIADDLERRLKAAGSPADEARAQAEVVAAGYATRAARMKGALGDAEALYLREHPDLVGPDGRSIPPGSPPGNVPADAPLAPSPSPLPAVARAPRKPKEIVTPEGAPAREIGVNHEGNPIFEDERGVRSVLHPNGIRETESVVINPHGGIALLDRRGADFEPVDPQAKVELQKPAPEPVEPTKQQPAPTTPQDEWDRFTANKLEKSPPKLETSHNPDTTRAGAPLRKGGRQEWTPGNLVDVGFLKDLLVVSKAEDGSTILLKKPDENGQSQSYESTPHGGLERSDIVDFMSATEHLRAQPEPAPPKDVSSVEASPEPAPAPPAAPEIATEAEATAAEPTPHDKFLAAVKHRLWNGEQPFKSILEARKLAKEHGLEFPEGESANKAVDELVERAVVETARDIVEHGRALNVPQADVFKRMVALYGDQPNLSTRTSTSIAEQAYSTPAPLAYVASRLAGIDHDVHVLEPSGGNGMLLMEADPRRVRVNELNPARAASLKAQGFHPSQVDGAAASTFADQVGAMDAVIANPPFGTVREGGKSKVFEVDGFETTQIDHAISLNALKTMKSDGKAVLIIGGIKAESEAERAAGYMGKAKRRFFHKLLAEYNVTDAFTVNGDLYAKQGAGWPVDVIVIDGKGKSERVPFTKEPPPLLSSWDAIGERLNVERKPASAPVAEPDRPAGPTPVADGTGPAEPNEVGGQPPIASEPVAKSVEDAGARGLDGTGDSSEPGFDGPINPLAQREGLETGRSGDVREPNPPTAPDRKRAVESDVNEGQVKYEPASQEGVKLNTLLPANLRDATNESLDRLESVKGPIDDYVAKALGREKEELGKYFSAEQIDAIGLGISNIQKGEGFIIGDQTGIGKGRVVAAMITYAKRNGLTPVFVTEKPDLYGDMWRDLHDIGWHEQLGRPIEMTMTNSGTRVPLDDEALEWIAERDAAKEAGQPLPPQRGSFSASQSPAKATDNMRAIVNGEASPDVVFTTYDQMNSVKGGETDRRNFLRAIAPRAFLIMDEAHNAGGSAPASEDGPQFKSKGAPPRSDVFREVVDKAHSVMYSSATYAKSPNVMTLYSKTDMAKAVDDPKKLPELISKGGVPLQQVVAGMLAKAGQYMRRERSFDGVEYGQETVPVSEKAYSEFTTGLRAVFDFDRTFEKERAKLAEAWAAERGGGTSRDGGVGENAASSTSFSSIMHNVISQMIMALKAEKAGERAVEALKAGEKPVLALSKTNASFISDYMADAGLAVGDSAKINFADILKKYLERTRRVTMKTGGDEKVHYVIPLADMSVEMQALYHRAEDTLGEMDVGELPVSPIDAIRNVIQKAGYTVHEVTGRSEIIDYSTPGGATFAKRPVSEVGPSGKKMTVKKFNDGTLDAVILNKSGSTGISMHASSKFKDQRRRRMIIAEADPNIDTHMQMLGRVHRTGQIIPPAYTQLAADIPAEVRPNAVLMRKMASLNANTTGAAKSRFTSDAVDFLNKYGDQVVKGVMYDDPETWMKLGMPIDPDPSEPIKGGEAAKVTGKLTLLEPKEQQALLDKITSEYTALIKTLDASGTNDLEAKSLDLRAKTLDSKTLKPATGPSPFQGAVNLDKVSIKSQGRAMEPREVMEHIANAAKVKPGKDFIEDLPKLQEAGRKAHAKLIEDTRQAAISYMKDTLPGIKDPEAREAAKAKINENFAKVKHVAEMAHPGAVVTLKVNGEDLPADVVSLKQKEGTKSPVAPSSWEAIFAFPDSTRSLGLPLSRIDLTDSGKQDMVILTPNHTLNSYQLNDMFEAARKEGRETRYMMTGNILGAFDETKGRGQIINHTMEDGSTRPAILMNRTFKPEEYMAQRAVKLASGEHVLSFLNRMGRDAEVTSSDGFIKVTQAGAYINFEVPSAKATGGKYYADSTVRAVYDSWQRRGGKMVAEYVPPDRATRMIDAMRKVGATFETRKDQDAAVASAPPAGDRELSQSQQGKIRIRQGMRSVITLFKAADASTFLHETAHDWLEKMMSDAQHEAAPQDLRDDAQTVRNWLGAKEDGPIAARQHERFARGFEQYLREGIAPSKGLAGVFAQFKNWLMQIYASVKSLGRPINDDIRGVFDRMLAEHPQKTIIAGERGGPSLATIHEHDLAETPPHEAEAAGDRVIAERDQATVDHPPEIANEIASAHAEIQAAAKQAKGEGDQQQAGEPGGSTAVEPPGEAGAGAGGSGALAERGGQSEPVTPGGGGGERPSAIEPGSGGSVSEGAGSAARVSRPEPGRGAGDAVPFPQPSINLDLDPESRLVDKAGNIRIDNLNIAEDVAKAIREAAESNNNFIGDRRGKITDGMVEMIADALGMDFHDMALRKIGDAWNAEQIWAARKLLIESATTVRDLAKKAAEGTDEDVLAYAIARDRHQMVQATVAGITAEAGRALRAFRRMEGQEGAEALDQIIQSTTGRTLYQLKKEAKLASAIDSPDKVSKFLHDASKRGFGDMILEYWINGLISGPATHATYMVGNTAFAAWRAGPETAVAAMLGRLREGGRENKTRVRGEEVGAQFGAARRSLAPALAGAAQSFREGVTLRLPGEKNYDPTVLQPGQMATPGMTNLEAGWKDAAANSFGIVRGIRDAFVGGAAALKAGGIEGEPMWGARYSNLGAIPDVTFRGVGVLPIGTAARLPGRFVASIHTFFRIMGYSMEKSALGVRQALEEGHTGSDLEARIGELWQNPTQGMMSEAVKTATEGAFMSSQGEFTRNLARLTNTPFFGIKLLKFIDPFVRISSNIIEEGLAKRTPLGVFSPAIRADLMGKNGNVAADRAAARMLCGTATAMLMGGLAANGWVSGSGPTDTRLNAVWRLAGNQAHSVRIGDMWYDMHRLGSLGLLMSTAADMYDVAHAAESGDMVAAGNALLHGLTQNILDESFMRGPADLLKAVEDPGRYGEQYIRQWAGSFLPYSVGLAQMARASDPYARQARTVMDEIKRRIPGESETLFPRRDIWGEPIANPDALIAAGVTAFYERQMSHDPVNLAMLALGIGPATLERKIRGVQLEDGQYDDFQRIAGRMAKMRLDAIVGSGQFSSWPAHVQHDVIAETIKQSREAARGVMMMKYPSIMRSATEAKLKKARGEE